jgi:hypothetical protein
MTSLQTFVYKMFRGIQNIAPAIHFRESSWSFRVRLTGAYLPDAGLPNACPSILVYRTSERTGTAFDELVYVICIDDTVIMS